MPDLHLGITVLDIIIFLVIGFYAYEGYALGFVLASVDLGSFILSFILALRFYQVVAKGLMLFFSLPIGFANAIGFFILAFVSEVFLSWLFRRAMRLLPRVRKFSRFSQIYKKADHWFGLIPGMLSAFIIVSFLLALIVSLPSSPLVKQFVTDSRLGKVFLANTSFFEKQLNTLFGGALNETLNFVTVEPQSNESVDLHAKVTQGTVDEKAEQEMFALVNKERMIAGLPALVFNNLLRDVARAHSQDMFARGYFSHYTPDGKSPFDRMNEAGVPFTYAGENLALAPSTPLAHQGLMNSPGHRANILSPNFRKIGIGVIDGGIYGKMYSQEFTD